MNAYRGTVWRHVPVGAVPQHLGWILKAARGRWNTQRPRMPCLCTALTPEGAIAELDKHAEQFAGRHRRRDLVSLVVDVDDMLDLTSRFVRARHRIDAARLVGDAPADLAYCRAFCGALGAPAALTLSAYDPAVDHDGRVRQVALRAVEALLGPATP